MSIVEFEIAEPGEFHEETTLIMKIVLAGGSGFLGRTLIEFYGELRSEVRGDERVAREGAPCEVVVLSRRPLERWGARVVEWDARTLASWSEELEGADLLLNLAGRSVDCRYNDRNRRLIMESRTESTRVLGEAVAQCANPPKVWMNSSTATIYTHSYDTPHDEHGSCQPTPAVKDPFSIEVAKAWERVFEEAAVTATRKIVLRTAMVLGNQPGGVYEVFRRLTRLGLGGRMGEGRQYVSWLHALDFCRAIEFLRSHSDANGIYNLSAPEPLTNADMCVTLRSVLRRPVGLPHPRFMLELGAVLLRTETELILKSRRVVPGRLLAEGFAFEFPTFESAIRDLEQQRSKSAR